MGQEFSLAMPQHLSIMLFYLLGMTMSHGLSRIVGEKTGEIMDTSESTELKEETAVLGQVSIEHSKNPSLLFLPPLWLCLP